MSSSSQPPATPERMSSGTVVDLPVRRRSSPHSDSRSSSSSGHALTPQSSLSGEPADDHHLSPYRTSSSRGSFQFGQSGDHGQPDENTAFTFRSLHNVTPRPSPPAPGTEPLTSIHPEPVELSASALPILPAMVTELPQPLHTLYSDEKITIRSGCDARRAPRPYNVRDEECPAKPFFDRIFQEALGKGVVIASRTVAALEKVAGPAGRQSDLEKLLKVARDLSEFETCDTRTIGVLGDSGEGKFHYYP